MTRSCKWLFLGFACAGCLLIGLERTANATLTLTATESGGPTITVVDNVSPDMNPALGEIDLGSGFSFGDFTVNGSISISNSLTPPTVQSSLASSSLSVINNTAASHTIDLMISDTSFTAPPSPLLLVGSASGTFSPLGTNTSVSGSSAQAQAFADSTNTLFGTGFSVQNYTFNTVSGPGGQSYSNTASQSGFSYAGDYSLTVELTFTVAGSSELTSRSDVINGYSATPEPATILAALAGLPILGLLARQRRRKA